MCWRRAARRWLWPHGGWTVSRRWLTKSLLLAYIPPLWRAVMDKRVIAHYGGDASLANIQPSKRAKFLAKYAAA